MGFSKSEEIFSLMENYKVLQKCYTEYSINRTNNPNV